MSKRKTHDQFLEDFKSKSPHAESLTIVGHYEKAREPLAVRCLKCGYEWSPTPNNLLSGCGCPECAGNRQKTHDDFVRSFAEKSKFANTIEFLEEYKGAFIPIKSRCISCGNEWSPLPTNLLKGDRGCPICAGSGKGSGANGKKTHDEFVSALAKANPKAEQIEVIGRYERSDTPLKVRCKTCSYEWNVTPSSLMQGSGCPRCVGRGSASSGKRTHEEFLSDFNKKNPYARSIKLVGKYVDARSEIQCVCAMCGNVWNPSAGSLLNGSGCPVCANKRRAISKTKTHEQFLKDFKARHPHADYIEIVGMYSADSDPIDVQCVICGHRWRPTATHLLSHPTGCPSCAKSSTSYMEQYILRAFRHVLGDDQVIHRDKDAIGLELDIFIPSLNVAIEPGSWTFHKANLRRDEEKRSQGIRVITVYDSIPREEALPFSDDLFRFDFDLGSESGHRTLRTLVEDLFETLSIKHSFTESDWKTIENEAYAHSTKRSHAEFLEVLRERSEKYANNEFEIIGRYLSDRARVECRCNQCGLSWHPAASNLLQGQGCPRCCGTMQLSHAEFLERFTRQNPYQDEVMILGEYLNNSSRIECKCKVCGNEWAPTAHDLLGSSLRPGHGCPKCTRNRRAESKTKSHERFLAEFHKLNPHSDSIEIVGTYEKATKPIRTRCAICNHEWTPTPSQLIHNKSGCPECAKVARSRKTRKSHAQFVSEVSDVSHGSLEIVGVYRGDAKTVECTCLTCGCTWLPIAGNLLRGQGCPECGKRARADARKKRVLCVETGEIFVGTKAAAEHCGIKTGSSISNAIRLGGCAAGFHWQYVE